MRAMVVRRYGPPEVFESQEVPDPQPKPGEVLIRVKAVGVNFADLLQRMGIYPGTPKPPFVPGFEIAGVVEKVVEGGKAASGRRRAFASGRCRCRVSRISTPTRNGLRFRRAMAVSPARRNAVRRWRGDSRELSDRVSLDVRDGKSAAGRSNPDSRRSRRRGNRRDSTGARRAAW